MLDEAKGLENVEKEREEGDNKDNGKKDENKGKGTKNKNKK